MSYMSNKIHIVDGNSSRRAQIAFDLASCELTTQIYEDVAELLAWKPKDGLVLLNETAAGDAIEKITQTVTADGAFVPVAMYSDEPSTMRIVRSMLAGAIDYLEWPFDASRLEETLAKVDGEAALKLRAAQKRSAAESATATLTEREREVLIEMIDGLGNKEIAKALSISPRTVEVHRANLLAKLNARSTSDAIRIGIYAGLDRRD